MGLTKLKRIKNNSNVIERKILERLSENNENLNTLIHESIENLGFNVKKEFFSEDILVVFVYLDILKDHVLGKDKVYNNYQIILDHIEKVENALDNLNGIPNKELLEFREWLGISNNFHNTLISL
ncbi:hypothetical protein [Clostridium thermobutyricum]|uniref:Uncharacterized protein n=1 Tax=Clostridium thermobutyricum TaxID=29372 RepID=N9Y0Z3_9CLOT|nr:hypothetical protein [Clostridium thermobutyricum]ENZ01814.1 hypothetical protein HMPREF1092_01048 [Clostridium thermobutyricum]